MDGLSVSQREFLDYVSECILDNSEFNIETVSLIVEDSSFRELLTEDEQFIGHYPPEYWAKYVLDEYLMVVSNVINLKK